MTIITDPTNLAGQARRPSARLRFAVAFLIGLVLTFGLGAGALYAYDAQYVGRILPGVRVGGVDLSGLTPDAARAKLRAAYAGLADGRIALASPDATTVITFAEIGRGLDTDGLVTEALAVGRDGSVVDRAVADAPRSAASTSSRGSRSTPRSSRPASPPRPTACAPSRKRPRSRPTATACSRSSPGTPGLTADTSEAHRDARPSS